MASDIMSCVSWGGWEILSIIKNMLVNYMEKHNTSPNVFFPAHAVNYTGHFFLKITHFTQFVHPVSFYSVNLEITFN